MRCTHVQERTARGRDPQRAVAPRAKRPNACCTAESPSRRRPPNWVTEECGCCDQALDDQLDRARRLFEYGEYDWETFCKRRDELNEQKRQLENATEAGTVDVEWCESQLLDFTRVWEAADSSQRERLVAGIFEHLEAEALPEGSLRVVAVPREAWTPFFEGLVLERETGSSAPSTNQRVEFVYRVTTVRRPA